MGTALLRGGPTGQRLPVAEEEIVKNGGELLPLHLREPDDAEKGPANRKRCYHQSYSVRRI